MEPLTVLDTEIVMQDSMSCSFPGCPTEAVWLRTHHRVACPTPFCDFHKQTTIQHWVDAAFSCQMDEADILFYCQDCGANIARSYAELLELITWEKISGNS